jgi:NADH dehydrogenase
MKIVIVGGGFAGLRLARKLNNKPGFEIHLVDKFNYHQFQPLYYQVATASLDASNISFPFRKAFHESKNVHVRMAELKQIVPNERKIVLDTGDLGYDVLVLAMGADTNFFGNKEIAANAFPLKTTVEAIQLRHRLIQNFEDALTAKSDEELQRLMNIVVIGGGPTGVELSGSLAELKKYVLPKDYPELDFSRMAIYLLEGGERTLGGMSQKSSDDTSRYLKRLGVTVLTKTVVKNYDGDDVLLADGKTIPSNMVIWAAGIRGNVPVGVDKAIVVKGNRIKVDRHNLLVGSADIYVLGDLAYMETERYPIGHPQVASVAIQQADVLADNLKRIERKSTKFVEFEYNDKGSMAIVGRHLGVVDLPKPKLHINGILAWFIWMALHLFLILGVKNRVFVFFNWVYSYVTYDQSLRLIFKEFYKPKTPVDLPKQVQQGTPATAPQPLPQLT